MKKNPYQTLGLLKSANINEIEMSYAIKSFRKENKNEYNEAANILRNETLRAKLDINTPYYLPKGWNMAHINHLPEYQELVLENLNGNFKDLDSEEPWLNMLSGTASYYQKNYNLALERFLKAEVSLLDDRHLYFNLALTYNKLKQQEKASAYLNRVLKDSLSYIELSLAFREFPLSQDLIKEQLINREGISANEYLEVLENLVEFYQLNLANEIWENATKLYPDNLNLHYFILQIALARTDFLDASRHFHILNRKFPNTKPNREAARLLTQIGVRWYQNLWSMHEYVTAIKILGQVTSINLSYEKLLAESVKAFLNSNPNNMDKLKIEPEILKANGYFKRSL